MAIPFLVGKEEYISMIFHASDEGSFVQSHAIKRARNEYQPPEWPDLAHPEAPNDDGPEDGVHEHSASSDSERSSQQSSSPEYRDDEVAHYAGASRTVLLYWRDHPAIHAQIYGRDVEDQLAAIAAHLGI